MTGESLNIIQDQLEKLKQLLPEAVTEGKFDWEKLQATLGKEYIEFGNERYVLNWAGKSDAFKVLQQTTTATLKPVPEESVNFDNTENVFIEGENMEVLKVLQKSYYGKIKCIIIDPPYNTGSDSFIYPDSFKESKEDYQKRIGEKDEEGYLLKEGLFRKNSRDSGHFHSNWLSMMYPRLFLARNLLTDDGVIFVHIDDNEAHNLRLMMNEIFGEENILAQFIWRTDGNFDNQAKVKNCHEYILAFCKDLSSFPHPPTIDPSIVSNSKLFLEEIRNTIVKNGPANPISQIVLPVGFPADFEKGKIAARNNIWPHYTRDAIIENFKLTTEVVIESGWSSKDLALEFISNNLMPIIDSKGQETTFIISRTGAIEVIKKRKENQSHVVSVLTSLGNTQTTSANLKKDKIYFDYPKPIQLERYLLSMNEGTEFITLDFFGGSGTTAQAILELNKDDGGNRKFIIVQLPEKCDENSEAFKAGYRTIADISKERIRRGAEVTEENLEAQLDAFTDPVKPESIIGNMLCELILKSGYLLTDKIESKGKYYSVNNGELAVALDEMNPALVEEIISSRPQKVITLDKLFAGNDQLKTNTVIQMKDAGIDFKTV